MNFPNIGDLSRMPLAIISLLEIVMERIKKKIESGGNIILNIWFGKLKFKIINIRIVKNDKKRNSPDKESKRKFPNFRAPVTMNNTWMPSPRISNRSPHSCPYLLLLKKEIQQIIQAVKYMPQIVQNNRVRFTIKYQVNWD